MAKRLEKKNKMVFLPLQMLANKNFPVLLILDSRCMEKKTNHC